MMQKILISACLLGQRVRYDGRCKRQSHPVLDRWVSEGRLIAVCPEVAGGLPVPRPAAEILQGDGYDVLNARSRVLTRKGDDVTFAFIRGARMILDIAIREKVRLAILKSGSPSCGTDQIYDGTFSNISIFGIGVAAALLKKGNIRIFSENALTAAARYLGGL